MVVGLPESHPVMTMMFSAGRKDNVLLRIFSTRKKKTLRDNRKQTRPHTKTSMMMRDMMTGGVIAFRKTDFKNKRRS